MESLPLNAASLGADLRDNSEDDEGMVPRLPLFVFYEMVA